MNQKLVVNLKKIAFSTALFSGLLISLSTQAETSKCYGQYGQEIPCPIINKNFNVEKTVISGNNLVEEVRGLKKNDVVKFNIVVKNTGELLVSGLMVIDNLPSNLEFVSLTEGQNTVPVRVDGNSIAWQLDNFAPQNASTYIMTTKVNVNGIAENSEKCVVNIANIMYNGIKESSNTASVCINNPKGQILGQQELPETDVTDIALIGFSITVSLAGILGIVITKKIDK